MQSLKTYSLKYFVLILIAITGCSKGNDTTTGGGNSGGGGGGNTNNKETNCVISTISQVNSGSGTESSLSAVYNGEYDATKIIVYDSVHKLKSFEASFNYITVDSVRINQSQYIIRDASKRVIRFFTKSDLTDSQHADNYLFVYSYNNDGFLAVKTLFINDSKRANFSTTYNYTNNQLTSAVMTAPVAGNSKVLEATVSYDNVVNIKNWIYTFPDAMEGYQYTTMLNFGKRVNNPLKKMITKIYDPASGSLIDTWTTDYGNYKIDLNSYVLSAEATGDLQQGFAAFYGKTNFYYACH
jgi:hypothetical protein